MKRNFSIAFSLIAVLALVWYLFIRSHDYLVTFTVPTFPGTINQSIKAWHKTKGNKASLTQQGLQNLTQNLQFGDTLVSYDWEITALTDSTSRVKVGIKDPAHSLKNRIRIPFTKTVLEKHSKKTLLEFNDFLRGQLKKFKVRLAGTDTLNTVFCAFLPAKSTQADKAFTMMRDHSYLGGFIKDNDLQVTGNPFLEITKWDKDTDHIEFNFCYPIVKTDSLPEHHEIKYKNFGVRKALKAIYNGNYITSDRAWYRLLQEAEKRNIAIHENPIEIFYDNPALGGNELEWKAEVFMPLIDENE